MGFLDRFASTRSLRGVTVQLSLLDSTASESSAERTKRIGIEVIMALLTEVLPTGGQDREVAIRVQDANGIEREMFKQRSLTRARAVQSAILKHVNSMSVEEIDAYHRNKQWHTIE